MMHSATSHFKEKYGEKYLIIDSAEKYKKVSSGIKPEIKTLNDGKGLFYEKNYAKLGINTDGHLPLKKKKTKIPKTNNNYQMCSSIWKIVSTNLFKWMFVWVPCLRDTSCKATYKW